MTEMREVEEKTILERETCSYQREEPCSFFMSIFEAIDVLRKGEGDHLLAVPQITDLIRRLEEVRRYFVPIYTPPDACGICFNPDVLSQREEITIRQTVVVEPNAQERLAEKYQVFKDGDDNERRVIVDKSGEERWVLFKGPGTRMALPDIGCYEPSQRVFDSSRR